jgi:hypothetical protein
MIIRGPKNSENPYAQISKFALGDPGLTWKAKGILAYLLTLTDNWVMRPKEIQRHAKDGRDSIYSGLTELIEAGYLVREQKRNNSGVFRQITYILHEFPLLDSVLTNHTGIPDTGFPYAVKTEEEKTRIYETGHRVAEIVGSHGLTGNQVHDTHTLAAVQNRQARLTDGLA